MIDQYVFAFNQGMSVDICTRHSLHDKKKSKLSTILG
jgi:hypothetical protein